jgi:hypothetical protein
MTTLRSPISNRVLAWVLVLLCALGYPLVVLAGGAPSFPSRDDCIVPATHDGPIELVFGHYDSVVRATAELKRVRAVGYANANVETDGGCARVKIVVDDYTTLASARDAAGEARSAGLQPTLEQGS